MAKYKCKNFGSCSVADSGKELEVALGGDDRCPECGMTVALMRGHEPETRSVGISKLLPIGAVVAALVLAGGGYMWWRGNQVVVLKPDRTTPATVASKPTTTTQPSTPVAEPSAAAATRDGAAKAHEGKNSEANVGEVAARRTCDEATHAKSPDAAKVCRRAAAVTLLNAGAQAAVAGNLDQAEKDYLAAKDKDPDIPELYFNVALLKARQGKGSEAVDNLTLAASKGFRRFDLIATEPAFAKLKSDPVLKAKLDVLSTK